MTLSASSWPELRVKWAKAHSDARVPCPHGALELRPGVSGPLTVLWAGRLTTAWLDGKPAKDPSRR